MKACTLLVHGISQLATAEATADGKARCGRAQAELRLIDDAALAIEAGRLLAVGPRDEVEAAWAPSQRVDLAGRVVLPGFVDCHTHMVYAGSREGEWAERLAGRSYADIAKAGGGILSTVRATRETSLEGLVEQALPRLDRALLGGTTSMEVKSGYGLELGAERKQLEAVARLDALHPIDLVATFMGAHEVAPEYRQDKEGYVALLCETMLPQLRELADYCDIFCEDHVFSVETSRRIMQRAQELGYKLRIHADEIVPLGGAELAAELGAVSAEHLVHISEPGIASMAARGTIAVLLPLTCFYLKCGFAPARRMVEAGVPIALASDSNPGSAFSEAMPLALTIACLYLGLRPAEALVAATWNAACAIDRQAEVGSLEAGKLADFSVWDCQRYEGVLAHFGQPRIHSVYKAGQQVVSLQGAVARG